MRQNQGFSLLEVLIVVTIISAIATIAMPNLLKAIDRGRQSSTMADMRTIGTTLERYAVDHLSYPTSPDLEKLRSEVQPEYVKRLPTRDGWGHLFVLEVDAEGASFELRSPGKDGEVQEAELVEVTHDVSADIVMVDGVFVQRPVGKKPKDEDIPEAAAPESAE